MGTLEQKYKDDFVHHEWNDDDSYEDGSPIDPADSQSYPNIDEGSWTYEQFKYVGDTNETLYPGDENFDFNDDGKVDELDFQKLDHNNDRILDEEDDLDGDGAVEPRPPLVSKVVPLKPPTEYYVSLPSTSPYQSTDPSNNSGAGISGGRSLGGGHEKPDNSTGGGSGSTSGSGGTGSTGGTTGGTGGAGSSTGGSGGTASGGGTSSSGTGGGGADSGRAANPPGSTTNKPGQVSGVNNQTSPNKPNTDLVSPVLLDLDGNGVKITEFGNSTQFMAGKDGLQHRSSWAGAGDGVLFYDPDGRGAITEARQYVFTDWAPTAQGDLEAIRQVWDTNGDGKLSAADAEFAKFKVMVTGADGQTSVKTLTELGITEIDLTANATRIEMPDGSVITGQTTFTRSNGTTGTVANTTLVTDAAGYRVEETVGTDGVNRVVTQTGYGGMRLAA